jgi:hypothetical protein
VKVDPRRAWVWPQYWLAENMADHHRQLPGPLMIVWAQFLRGAADGRGRGLPQCSLLIGAKYERGQLLATRVREYPNASRP